MNPISETDLIINPDGSIYHLCLRPEEISKHIITVGDPDRVGKISQKFDRIDFKKSHREFVTHRGQYQGKDLTVMSTGMGTDNMDIFLTELDALANVDFTTRKVKSEKTMLNIVRVGTSGSMQKEVEVGALLASSTGVGLDSLMSYYVLHKTTREAAISKALQTHLALPFEPYCVAGSARLRDQLASDMIIGHTATCPGFYGPQGRAVRAANAFPNLMEQMSAFRYEDYKLTNFEMETAAYYAMGRILGHEVLSLNAVLANRVTHEFASNPESIVENLIQKVLDRI